MVSKFRVLLVMTAVAVGSMLTAAPAQADILYNWFGPEYVAYRPMFPGRYAVAYAPAVAYSPVATGCNTCATTVAYAPVATGCNTCATTVGYAPYTSWYPRRAYYQPVTSYYGGCNTCGVQTAMYAAPACSSCGVAAGGCASGNCGVNYGAVSSGCSTCGVASAVPTSNFEPTPAYGPTPAPAYGPTPAYGQTQAPGSTYNVPTTQPEGANHGVPAPSNYNVPRTTPEGTNPATPTPAIAPQSAVPRTELEPAEVAPDMSGAVNGPALFRGSATQQLSPQMRAVPHTNDENGNVAPQVRPQLVDPQDKTARANTSNFEVKQAVYSTPVAITPVNATPSIKAPQPLSTSLNVLTQRAKSQEEVDAEGWAPAQR